MGQFSDIDWHRRFAGRTALGRVVSRIKYDESGCWLWQGGVSGTTGYSSVSVYGNVHLSGHRFMFQAWYGPIPAGMDLDHLCRVRRCVNPEHLEPVTRQVNLLRGETVTAANAAKTHCVHGHEFTAKNTYSRPDRKGINCRTCRRQADLRTLARLRSETKQRQAARASQAPAAPAVGVTRSSRRQH